MDAKTEAKAARREECQRLVSSLPSDAQPSEPLARHSKSYTLKRDDSDVSIGVHLYKKTWYISPVDSIPVGIEADINSKMGVQVAFGHDPADTWFKAQLIAGRVKP